MKVNMISFGYLKVDYDSIEMDNKTKGANKMKEHTFFTFSLFTVHQNM